MDILGIRPKLTFSAIPWVQLRMHKLAFCLVQGKWSKVRGVADPAHYVKTLSGVAPGKIVEELLSSNRILCYITNDACLYISKEKHPNYKYRRIPAEKALELIETTLLLVQVHES
jgi:hypothetical protein